MFKILQARLKQYMNCQIFKLDLEKAEEPEIKLTTSIGHWKSKRVPEKHLLLLYWLYQSLWLYGSQHCGKFLKRQEYQTTWAAYWEICRQIKKKQLELYMEQKNGSKSVKEYIKPLYCHPAYLIYMQRTSWEMLDWRTYKLESRFQKKYQ